MLLSLLKGGFSIIYNFEISFSAHSLNNNYQRCLVISSTYPYKNYVWENSWKYFKNKNVILLKSITYEWIIIFKSIMRIFIQKKFMFIRCCESSLQFYNNCFGKDVTSILKVTLVWLCSRKYINIICKYYILHTDFSHLYEVL